MMPRLTSCPHWPLVRTTTAVPVEREPAAKVLMPSFSPHCQKSMPLPLRSVPQPSDQPRDSSMLLWGVSMRSIEALERGFESSLLSATTLHGAIRKLDNATFIELTQLLRASLQEDL